MFANSNPSEWIKAMADVEHDDPEHAPTYHGERLVLVGGVAWVTEETARELEAA